MSTLLEVSKNMKQILRPQTKIGQKIAARWAKLSNVGKTFYGIPPL